MNVDDIEFSPVIVLPDEYEVYDFSMGYDPNRPLRTPYGIGRYNEKRPGMYVTDLFTADVSVERRDVHMGVDIAAPVGTPVRAFYDGRLELMGVNDGLGDYGATLITRHDLRGRIVWALYGHLSLDSLTRKKPGDSVACGEVIGWIGDRNENGGWNPHLHFQLSLVEPDRCDMPGVVSESDRTEALRRYPDPRMVLGSIY